jgi:ABC-type metal ion transport system substrate-binding protein
MKITVEKTVSAPIADVWRAYTTPEDIKRWNVASIPNDRTNGGRVLLLLRDKGAIELKDGVGYRAGNRHGIFVVEESGATCNSISPM